MADDKIGGWEVRVEHVPLKMPALCCHAMLPSPALPVESVLSTWGCGTGGPVAALDRLLWGMQVQLVPVLFTGASCQDCDVGCQVGSGFVLPLPTSVLSPCEPS